MKKDALEFLLKVNDLQKTNRYGNYPSFSESVSEHTFKLILIVDYFYRELKLDISYNKCIALAIYHDFGEMNLDKDVDIKENTDINLHNQKEVYELETIKNLSEDYYNPIFDYYMEYKDKETSESLFVNACDKLEGMIHPLTVGLPIMNHEIFATYADDAIKRFPKLIPIYMQIKSRLKILYTKWGFEWKKDYDFIIE